MANDRRKKIIDIDINTGESLKHLEDLKNELNDINDGAKDVGTKGKDDVENFGRGAKGSTGLFKGLGGAVKAVGTSLKAMGIGLIIAAFVKLGEMLMKNEKVAKFFEVAMASLEIVFRDLFGWFEEFMPKIKQWFKELFENPQEKLKEFGKAIMDNLIFKFNSLIKLLGSAGKALAKLLQGDWDGLAEELKEAGKSFLDMYTGVEGSVDKLGKKVSEFGKKVSEYAKNVIAAAGANVDLARAVQLATAQQQVLLESYDRAAEKQRQIRDDESLSIADRIAANNKLGKVLDDQEDAMINLANLAIKKAQMDLANNKTIENQVALIEAQGEKEAVLAHIEGLRSEQLTNKNALEKESIKLNDLAIKGAENRSIKDKEYAIANEKDTLKKLALEEELNNTKKRLAEEEWQRAQNTYAKGSEAYVSANQAYLDSVQETANREKDIIRDKNAYIDEQTTIANNKRQAKEDAYTKFVEENEAVKRQANQETLDFAIGLADEETALYDGLMIFKEAMALKQDILDAQEVGKKAAKAANDATLKATEAGIDMQAGMMKTAASLPFPMNLGPIAGYTIMAIPLLTAVYNAVRKIKGSKTGGSGGSTGVGAAPKANFSIVGNSSQNQLLDTLTNQQQQPIQAYVVSQDVTTATSLDRNRIESSTFL